MGWYEGNGNCAWGYDDGPSSKTSYSPIAKFLMTVPEYWKVLKLEEFERKHSVNTWLEYIISEEKGYLMNIPIELKERFQKVYDIDILNNFIETFILDHYQEQQARDCNNFNWVLQNKESEEVYAKIIDAINENSAGCEPSSYHWIDDLSGFYNDRRVIKTVEDYIILITYKFGRNRGTYDYKKLPTEDYPMTQEDAKAVLASNYGSKEYQQEVFNFLMNGKYSPGLDFLLRVKSSKTLGELLTKEIEDLKDKY